MVKFIIGCITSIFIIYFAGLYPSVAVGLTAISIVFIFKFAEWLNK